MAINAKIDLKKPVLEEISAQVEGAQCVLLVNYSGLTVAQDTQLRKELREAGVHYKVYKNTMMKRAFAGTAFESLTKDLDGTNAIAISKDDATAPARIIAKFAKTAPKLEMVSGVVEGNYYDKAGMEALANVPSREELLGKLLANSFDKMQSRVQYTSGLSCDTRLRSRKNRDLSDGGKAGRKLSWTGRNVSRQTGGKIKYGRSI